MDQKRNDNGEEQENKPESKNQPVPEPATKTGGSGGACEPTPTGDNPGGRKGKECPEGYPEEQPVDKSKEQRRRD